MSNNRYLELAKGDRTKQKEPQQITKKTSVNKRKQDNPDKDKEKPESSY